MNEERISIFSRFDSKMGRNKLKMAQNPIIPGHFWQN